MELTAEQKKEVEQIFTALLSVRKFVRGTYIRQATIYLDDNDISLMQEIVDAIKEE